MSLIMGPIWPEQAELFTCELGKNAEFDFVLTIASTNNNQSAPNLIQTYVSIKSRMISTMNVIGPGQSKLPALECEKLPSLNLFTL